MAGQGGEPGEGCLGTTRNRVVVIDFAIYFQKYASFVTPDFFFLIYFLKKFHTSYWKTCLTLFYGF